MKYLLRTIGLILAESRYRRAVRALRRATAEHTVAKARLIRRFRADAQAVRMSTPIISTTANTPRGGTPIDQAEHYVWRPATTAKVKSATGGQRTK